MNARSNEVLVKSDATPERGFRRQVLKRLDELRGGAICIEHGDTSRWVGESNSRDSFRIKVHDARFWRFLALGGGTGAGEGYIEGYWDCDDIVGLLRLLLRNRHLLEGMDRGFARIGASLLRAWHEFQRNNRTGSARNIAAHYDLGNDLFELFLDHDMHYSSAVFERDDMSLEQAQQAKLQRICRKLDLQARHHLLEIGTGWGGFAVFAAREFGCRVTTTTISRRQHERAQQRVREAGLEDRITVLLKDYRDLDGRFDRLVSIEMVEAVGHQYLDGFFQSCAKLLHDDGAMLLQAITIEDQRYEKALKTVDYIKRFVFPGSFIPCVSVLTHSAARSCDLRLLHLEDIGLSYARTLACWRERFEEQLETIRGLGYSEAFTRLWRYYLCYCEAGFAERAIGDAQMLFVKPDNRRSALLPPSTELPCTS